MDTVIGLYSIVIGVFVLGLWAASLVSRNVPELATKPWEIRAHISAETIMALTLIGGGALELAGAAQGRLVVILGLGMTIYSIVNSSGYYLQRRQLPPTIMFGVLLVLSAVAAGNQVASVVAALP